METKLECAICKAEVEGHADLCERCKRRVAEVIKRDLLRENELAFEELSKGATMDQPDGFF